MALTWITSMLKIYLSFSHHLLDGNGVCDTASSLLRRRKLGCAMHRQLIQFIACALPLALNLLCSVTRSAMLTHSGLRPVLGMPFTVLTPLFISMPEIIAWQEVLELPQLCWEDLRVSTAILGAAQVGQRNTQLPWIWSFGTTVDQDRTWMDECRFQ